MRYRMIDVRIWVDKKFRALSPLQPSGQALFLYLLTNPNTNSIPGLYRAGAAAMAEELGWSTEGFGRAFDELINEGLIKADLASRVVFIPNAIKYNKPQSPNVVKGWVSHWDEIPECDLKNIAYQIISNLIQGMGEAYMKAFNEAMVKPWLKTMSNQEQEQEQDQEQKISKVDFIEEPLFEPAVTAIQDNMCIQSHKDAIEREVFEHWRRVMNHPNAKFDSKRCKVIKAALNLGFTADALMRAIDGCAKSEWHMGKNPANKKYDEINLIFRDAEHIEKFISYATPAIGAHDISNIVSQIDLNAEGAI